MRGKGVQGFGIGELARLTHVRIANIRYYESVGLLPPAARRNGRHRSYDRRDAERVSFIRNSRELGFSIGQVRQLLHLAEPENLSCDEAKALAVSQLGVVRRRIDELRQIETTLCGHIASCNEGCAGGRAPQCGILDFEAKAASA